MMRSSLWFWFIAAAISLLPIICSAAVRDPSATLAELEKLKDKLRQTLENEASSAIVSRELQTAPPDCLSTDEEINSMLTSELRADASSKRIYYVCPGDYYLGQFDPSAPGFFVGGLASFFSRANAEYRCGTAEEPSTDCYFYEGSFQVWITGSPFPEPHEAVKFVGFNFESALGFGVLGDRPGDVTFEDCSFNFHQNQSPLLFFNQQDFLTTTYIRCTFEGNALFPPSQGSGNGIISALTPNNRFVLRNCLFIDNEFDDPDLNPEGYAIFTIADLIMTNCAFIGNKFRRLAPVVQLGPFAFENSGNYIDGPQGENNVCDFAVNFPNPNDYVPVVNFNCIEADSDEPRIDEEPATNSPTSEPTMTPTRETSSPTPQPTKAPTPQPTLSPTAAPVVPTISPAPTITDSPTKSPTDSPSSVPTTSPTMSPSASPTVSMNPTDSPTNAPTTLMATPQPSLPPVDSATPAPSLRPVEETTRPPTEMTEPPTESPSSGTTGLSTTKSTIVSSLATMLPLIIAVVWF